MVHLVNPNFEGVGTILVSYLSADFVVSCLQSVTDYNGTNVTPIDSGFRITGATTTASHSTTTSVPPRISYDDPHYETGTISQLKMRVPVPSLFQSVSVAAFNPLESARGFFNSFLGYIRVPSWIIDTEQPEVETNTSSLTAGNITVAWHDVPQVDHAVVGTTVPGRNIQHAGHVETTEVPAAGTSFDLSCSPALSTREHFVPTKVRVMLLRIDNVNIRSMADILPTQFAFDITQLDYLELLHDQTFVLNTVDCCKHINIKYNEENRYRWAGTGSYPVRSVVLIIERTPIWSSEHEYHSLPYHVDTCMSFDYCR